MRDIVKAFKTLSDETRLRILNLVLEREICVCEAMQALQISQSKASRGLNALYDAGFLKLRKEGLWSLYSIDAKAMSGYRSRLLEGVREVMDRSKVGRLDRQRLRNAERIGPACAGKACAGNPTPGTLPSELQARG